MARWLRLLLLAAAEAATYHVASYDCANEHMSTRTSCVAFANRPMQHLVKFCSNRQSDHYATAPSNPQQESSTEESTTCIEISDEITNSNQPISYCWQWDIPDVDIPVLYESDRILAVNKPHGVPHHDDDFESGSPGILNIIRHQQQLGKMTYQGRIYGVHRLDRVTSGILLLAKDQETAGALTRCFREREVIKYYFAISTKKPKKAKQGWVKGDMTKGRRGAWMLKKSQIDPSITRFFTAGLGGLSDCLVDGAPVPKTAILFRPHTGRTHQLRVAAKSIGLPIMLDPYYGDGTKTIRKMTDTKRSPLERTYLHATALHVCLDDDETITIWCPPPFGGLWEEDGGLWKEVVDTIFVKFCESEDILQVVRG